ncbi:hypothetical protein [Pseudomonas sp. KNUC1026]|uniref:hypothetical protein n=1 Tax=Pseudomonas sp. KNUC1026 TaxID=2893890 RepID=UPI001F41E8AA|nr:hypothetical protein [Pseudomonas sp. KNUC1026]UFH49555.1 hypothetical protein LN139_22595 [Pseudomonas sp. KNUC1026]
MADRLRERITPIMDMGIQKILRNIIPTPTRIPMNMVQAMGPMGKRRGSIMNNLPALNELLVAHNCLHALSVQLDFGDMAYNLSLSISAFESLGVDVVTIRFIDVSQFTAHDFGGGLTQLMHMRVERLSSGFDRMRYRLSDLEDKKLSFCFSSFSIE